jgi:thioesterase domain-containing protein
LQQLFFTFKANYVAMRRYVPTQVNQRVLLFKPDPDQGIDAAADRTNGWGSLMERPLEMYMVPGNHYTLLKHPCVELLAEKLEKSLITGETLEMG